MSDFYNVAPNSPATAEAIRTILTHEGVPFERATGVGGEVLIIKRANFEAYNKTMHEWYAAALRFPSCFIPELEIQGLKWQR